ncbi:MAG: hypothetical protein GXO90_09930 [FCB group bacterium]|nr:hypothetical protein [FCB group bacterium]
MENKNGKNQGHYFLLFYWNPDDKRIFVPKRWGFGWTVNLANPFSVLTMLGLLFAVSLLAKLL